MIRTATAQRAATTLVAPPKLVVGRALGTVVVTLHGEIDGPASRYLAAVLEDLIDGQGNLAVVVDLADLRSLDGSAVDALATATQCIGRRGGHLVLSRPSAEVAEMLETAGLGDSGGQPRRTYPR